MKKLFAFRGLDSVACAAIALALLAHYWVFFRYAANIPLADDYWDALRFLDNYLGADTWQLRLSAIFEQHNEHRTTLNRLVYTAMYEITGQLNFKTLMLIGDLSTIGTIVLVAAQCRQSQFYLYILAATAVFLLNLHSWGSMFWAMTAISNYCVVFFALASIHVLANRRRGGLGWAILLAVCATFSQGNGIFVWPVGLLYLCLEQDRQRLRAAAIWCGAALACLAIYFFDYAALPVTKISVQTLMREPAAWLRLATWFFAFMGSGWSFESNNVAIAIAAGLALCLAALPATIFLRRRAPVLAYFMVFLLLSGATASFSRFAAFDPATALAPRYRIYSVYLSCSVLIALYLYGQQYASAKYAIKPYALGVSILLVAVIHTAASYAASFEPMREARLDVSDSMRGWLLARKKPLLGIGLVPDAGVWAEKAVTAGYWDPRALFADALYFRAAASAAVCAQENFRGSLPFTIIRHREALVGELIVDDGSLRRRRIKRVLVCVGRQAYNGRFAEPARTIDGKQRYHFRKSDPVESADRILFVTTAGDVFRGQLSAPSP